MNLWRAGCSEMGTSGAEGGPRKRTGRNPGHRASVRPLRAPRGAVNRAVMKGHRPRLVAASCVKLGAAYPVETDGYGWQAAPTTTERASTVRWSGSGKRDGKVYVRNQRPNASQEQTTSSNLTDLGWAAARIRALARRTPWLVNVVGREATVKACGVAVARLQGHSWSPNPTSGSW
jgi:hypothetical protein